MGWSVIRDDYVSNQGEKMNLYFRALSYVKPYIFRAILAMLCAGIAAGGTAYLPWIIKDMVDSVLSHKDTAMLNYIVISIIVVFAIRGIAAFLQYYFPLNHQSLQEYLFL